MLLVALIKQLLSNNEDAVQPVLNERPLLNYILLQTTRMQRQKRFLESRPSNNEDVTPLTSGVKTTSKLHLIALLRASIVKGLGLCAGLVIKRPLLDNFVLQTKRTLRQADLNSAHC